MQRLASSVRDELGFGEMLSGVFSLGGVPSNEYFIGETDNDRFSIHRNIRYRNSFLPVIKGKITPEFPGSLIEVTMRLNVFAALFMAFWLGVVGFMALTAVSSSGLTSKTAMPAGMFAFGALLLAAGFFPEAIKARNKLKSLLEAGSTEGARRPTVSR
ncbi:hypothetical protein M2650_11435 [Luteimonas sp. SX5]|uniref:Uncharacterized protein n=2 Tax=Luteimonas galliterrae TaxID=2940486 RepID=A0ABT0MK19_9GAMM|nr:hypothetical protein [Luteimonas galliterrae]